MSGPQNTVEYWTPERRKAHGDRMRASQAYYDGLARRPDNSGERNPMYGRKASPETRARMSASRVGKLGPNATAWRGGKKSILRRVKGILHTRFGWYLAVFRRDGFTCTACGSKRSLDAHHIVSLTSIVRRLRSGRAKESDEDLIEWLVAQADVADHGLTNGQTLCRPCHRLAHNMWGSHVRP